MTIEAAIANLQAKALALSGMKSAPANPPEGAGAFPFAVSYERSGSFLMQSSGFGHDLAVIWTEIHVTRQMLPAAITTAMAFRDPFLKAVMADPTLGGSVSTVQTPITRVFGVLNWGGIETIGYRFEITCKLTVTI